MTFRLTGTHQVDVNHDGIPDQLTRTYADSAHPDRKITLSIDSEGHVRLSYPTQVAEGSRNRRHTVPVETRREAVQILMTELQQRRAALTRAVGRGEIPEGRRAEFQRDATTCQQLLDHIESLQRELSGSNPPIHLPHGTEQRIAQLNHDRNFQRVHNRIFGSDHFNETPHEHLTALQTRTMTPDQRQITVAAVREQIAEQLHTAELELSYYRNASPNATPASLRGNLERARDAFNRAVHAQRELEQREPSVGQDTYRTGQFASIQGRLEEGALQLYPTPSPTTARPHPAAPAQQRTFLASIQGAPGVARLTATHRRGAIGEARNTFEVAVNQAGQGHTQQARTTLAQAEQALRALRRSANSQHPEDRQILAGLNRAAMRAHRSIRFQELLAQARRTRNPEQATRLFARANTLMNGFSAGDTAREPLQLAFNAAHGDFMRAHPMPDINPQHAATPPTAIARREPPPPAPARPSAPTPPRTALAQAPRLSPADRALDRSIDLFNPAAPIASTLREARATLTRGDRTTAEALLTAARSEMNALPERQRSTLPRQIAALETRIQNARALEEFNGLLAQGRAATDQTQANVFFDQARQRLAGITDTRGLHVDNLRHQVITARREWVAHHTPPAAPDHRREIAEAQQNFNRALDQANTAVQSRRLDAAQQALDRAATQLTALNGFGRDTTAATRDLTQARETLLARYSRQFNTALGRITPANAQNSVASAGNLISEHIAPLLIALGRGSEVDAYTDRLTAASPTQGFEEDNTAVARNGATPSTPAPAPEALPPAVPAGRGVIAEGPGAARVAVAPPPAQPTNTITVPPNADPAQVVTFVEQRLVYQAEQAQRSGHPDRALAYANAAQEVLSHLRWANTADRTRLTGPLHTRLQQVRVHIPTGTEVAQIQLPQLPASVVRTPAAAPTMVAEAPRDTAPVGVPPAPPPARPGADPARVAVAAHPSAPAPAAQPTRPAPQPGSIEELLQRVGGGTPPPPLSQRDAELWATAERVRPTPAPANPQQPTAPTSPVAPAAVAPAPPPEAQRPAEPARPVDAPPSTPPAPNGRVVTAAAPAARPQPAAPPVAPAPTPTPPPAPRNPPRNRQPALREGDLDFDHDVDGEGISVSDGQAHANFEDAHTREVTDIRAWLTATRNAQYREDAQVNLTLARNAITALSTQTATGREVAQRTQLIRTLQGELRTATTAANRLPRQPAQATPPPAPEAPQPVQPTAVAPEAPPPPPSGRRVVTGEGFNVTGHAPSAGPAPLPPLHFGMTIPNFRVQAFSGNSYARQGVAGTVANLVSTLYRQTARRLPPNADSLPELHFTFRIHYSADGHTASIRVNGRLEDLPADVRPRLERNLRDSLTRGLPALRAGEDRTFDVTVNARP